MIRLILALTFLVSASAQAVTWGDFLRGQWVTDCTRSAKGTYQQNGYTFSDFSGPEFQIVIQGQAEFYDSKCSRVVSYGQNLGHLNLKSDMEPLKGAKIRWQIDPLIQFPFAFYDKKAVAELNRKSYCGQTDWEVGRAKDLLLTACSKDIKYYYANSWFYLEVSDKDHIRLSDKSGAKEEIHRAAFTGMTGMVPTKPFQ